MAEIHQGRTFKCKHEWIYDKPRQRYCSKCPAVDNMEGVTIKGVPHRLSELETKIYDEGFYTGFKSAERKHKITYI